MRRGITSDEVWEERPSLHRPKRVLEPVETARVIARLGSEAAGGISGEAIAVALGGMV